MTTVCPSLMRTGSANNASFQGERRTEYYWFNNLDSLPGLSMSAGYAARKILTANARGEILLVYPFFAKVGSALVSLTPSSYVRGIRAVSHLLPRNSSGKTHLGKESLTKLSPSILTTLTQKAAIENNELA